MHILGWGGGEGVGRGSEQYIPYGRYGFRTKIKIQELPKMDFNEPTIGIYAYRHILHLTHTPPIRTLQNLLENMPPLLRSGAEADYYWYYR